MSCGLKPNTELAGDYVLVSPQRINPDHHPGTSLQRGGKQVWYSVYPGGFHPRAATNFTKDGMMLFVGGVPEGPGLWPYPQLFAIRGDGPPLVISERLLQQRFSVDYETPPFRVRHLLLTNGEFQVQFEHRGTNVSTYDITWSAIKRFLDEGETSARLVHHALGDYRILSK
jgi:hypothetical protein